MTQRRLKLFNYRPPRLIFCESGHFSPFFFILFSVKRTLPKELR